MKFILKILNFQNCMKPIPPSVDHKKYIKFRHEPKPKNLLFYPPMLKMHYPNQVYNIMG